MWISWHSEENLQIFCLHILKALHSKYNLKLYWQIDFPVVDYHRKYTDLQ